VNLLKLFYINFSVFLGSKKLGAERDYLTERRFAETLLNIPSSENFVKTASGFSCSKAKQLAVLPLVVSVACAIFSIRQN
jgi:hypothetical protein